MVRQEGIRNPIEVEHPFSAELRLAYRRAILIDGRVIIALGSTPQGELALRLVAKTATPIVREKQILERGWFPPERREDEDRFGQLSITISEELGPVYVGHQYKIVYSGLHGGRLHFRLEATHPIAYKLLDTNQRYSEILENLERRRAK